MAISLVSPLCEESSCKVLTYCFVLLHKRVRRIGSNVKIIDEQWLGLLTLFKHLIRICMWLGVAPKKDTRRHVFKI